MIIISVFIIVSALIIANAIRKFWNMRGLHNRSVLLVYSLVLIWWLGFVASNIYSIVLHELHEQQEDSHNKYND
jgi:Co/Zn/Cd efflux system component